MAGGIFGGLIPSTPATQAGAVQAYQPQQYSLSDWLSLLGAGAKQISNGGDDIAQAQQTIAGRALAQQRQQAQQGLMSMFAQPGGAQSGGAGGLPSIGQLAPYLLRAQAAGVDITPYVNLLDKARPHITSAAPGAILYNDDGSVVARGTPDSGVADDFAYTKDPVTGAVTWGGQHAPSYGDQLGLAKLQFDMKQAPITNNIAATNAGANALGAQTGAATANYNINTGKKPGPWDRSWK